MILSSGLQIIRVQIEVYRSKALKQENYENVPRGEKTSKRRARNSTCAEKSFSHWVVFTDCSISIVRQTAHHQCAASGGIVSAQCSWSAQLRLKTRGSENQLYLNTFYWGKKERHGWSRKKSFPSHIIPYDISMVENTEQGGKRVGQNLNNREKGVLRGL